MALMIDVLIVISLFVMIGRDNGIEGRFVLPRNITTIKNEFGNDSYFN
jgi:hypothetical protein